MNNEEPSSPHATLDVSEPGKIDRGGSIGREDEHAFEAGGEDGAGLIDD